MTLTYSSTRSAIATWYWRSLRRNPRHLVAWIVWVFTAFLAGAFLAPSDPPAIGVGLVTGLGTAAALFLYPQLRFKPQTRTLTLLPSSISTSIAGIEKTYTWADVARVEQDGGFVVITFRNLNGFIIPPVAFAGPGEREGAVKQFDTWLSQAGAPSAA